ncbi:sortase domain-containing protein, partial [Clostridium cadaveris]
ALNGNFVYEVVDKFVVEPEETSVLNGYSDKKEITIVTCTAKGKERLIVKGVLK